MKRPVATSPRSSVDLAQERCRRYPGLTEFRPCGAVVCLLLTVVVCAAAATGEPNKDKSDKAATEDKFPGLGFSVASKDGGKGRTSFFGLVGEGYKFVYVMDRSGSMGGEGRKSILAVKAELRRSLESLDTVHQFQLVFYNERTSVFNPSGVPGRLAFATQQNKESAIHFIDSISAEGGTAHEAALRQAIALRPDVIFFLTDGDQPQLTAGQLATIRRMAAGVVINTIEFGPGPKPEKPGFLADLARENAGSYAYVDISRYDVQDEAER